MPVCRWSSWSAINNTLTSLRECERPRARRFTNMLSGWIWFLWFVCMWCCVCSAPLRLWWVRSRQLDDANVAFRPCETEWTHGSAVEYETRRMRTLFYVARESTLNARAHSRACGNEEGAHRSSGRAAFCNIVLCEYKCDMGALVRGTPFRFVMEWSAILIGCCRNNRRR